jgi:hypothetical protein
VEVVIVEGCLFCTRHIQHDGNCYGKSNSIITPCLLFERDPRGQQVFKTLHLPIPFSLEIPKVNEICDYYLIGEVDKPLKILDIKEITWNINKYGINEGIIIKAQVQYWSDENGVVTNKPKLQIIKGGQQCQKETEATK